MTFTHSVSRRLPRKSPMTRISPVNRFCHTQNLLRILADAFTTLNSGRKPAKAALLMASSVLAVLITRRFSGSFESGDFIAEGQGEIGLRQVHFQACMWIFLHEGQQVFLGVLRRISDNMLADFTAPSCRIICRSQFAPVQSERALQTFDQQATIRKQLQGVWVEFHGR
jgi:hypothetical protein